MAMDEFEFEEAINDILDNCHECKGTTLSYHAVMCSNSDHRILAQLAILWPDRIADEDSEDYEYRIRTFENDIYTLEDTISDLEDANVELRNRLKVWSTLCLDTSVNKETQKG